MFSTIPHFVIDIGDNENVSLVKALINVIFILIGLLFAILV